MSKLIRKSDIVKTNWSGGTTSEIFIHPNDASFKLGNYKLRISIATVEVEESIFTPLPDVSRTLMVLEGTLKLDHDGHHSSELTPFQQDSFSGGWNTKSEGKVIDFNVMTKNNSRATVAYIKLNSDQKIDLKNSNEIEVIHVLNGKLNYNKLEISSGESIVIYNDDVFQSIGSISEKTEIIRVSYN